MVLPDAAPRVSFFEREHNASHLDTLRWLIACFRGASDTGSILTRRLDAMMVPLADLISSGGLLFAWTLATIILCLLGWLAFTLRQRQFRNDPDE
ncbi:MAG TPA: hypothetical protein VKT82_08900 [Ktedonobacterales bacterium]|nr:hypothetical protein [Ktedonobacterales bacterium]